MKKIGKRSFKIIATLLAIGMCFNCVPAMAATNYRDVADVITFKNGKYIVQNSARGEIVYDAEGNVVISPGRYCRAEYLGGDLFSVYKIQDEINSDYLQYKELFVAYLYNAKTGKETPIQPQFQTDAFRIDYRVRPYVNGYAQIVNGAFYGVNPQNYYQFIDKKGKSVIMEQPYSYCSDLIKLSGELYFFTIGDYISYSCGDRDSLRRLSKRNSNGEEIKSILLPKDFDYDETKLSIVKSGKNFYIRVRLYNEFTYQDSWSLYSTNLKKVTKYSQEQIMAMKKYDPIEPLRSTYSWRDEDDYFQSVTDGKFILDREWVYITPSTTTQTSFDVAGASCDEGAWVMLWETKSETNKSVFTGYEYAELQKGYNNQGFIFEKVGTDSDGNSTYRIWSAHSGRQLKSYYDKADNITRLVQGSYSDKNSKGKVIKEQIFTVIENSDGSICIKNSSGKYLTMAYGSTESGTQLVFADYAGGDAKQRFKANLLSEIMKR